MTNEELVAAIQQGRTELMGQLWEQVERFVYKKANEAMNVLGAKSIPVSAPAPEIEPESDSDAESKSESELESELWPELECDARPKQRTKWSKSWRGIELEDLVQSGFLALHSAVQTHDPSKCAFITWLAYYLKTAFSRFGGYPTRVPDESGDRKIYRNPLNAAASLNAPLKSSDPDEGVLADVVPYVREDGGDDLTDLEDAIYNDQLHKALDSAIDTLPDEQAAAIRGRYWDDLQYSELAERCGVSSEQVQRDVRAGILSLRSPKLSRELSQFIEENTDYYRGAGLYSFRNTGASSVERAAVQRENREEQWRRWRMESAAKP